jgi:hypothetical protein
MAKKEPSIPEKVGVARLLQEWIDKLDKKIDRLSKKGTVMEEKDETPEEPVEQSEA